jgi:hypothetical protein
MCRNTLPGLYGSCSCCFCCPLPHGILYKQQQLEALRVENGILDIPDHEMAELAMRIRQILERKGKSQEQEERSNR